MPQRNDPQNRTEGRQRDSGLQRSQDQQRGLSRHDPFQAFGFSPIALMRRMQDDMDRLFGDFGTRRFASPFGSEISEWAPAIEAFQRGNELVVRADVPGLSREDLTVEVADDTLTIRGERKYDHEEEREGMFRSERSYGSFCRVVPLPEGTVADSAKAKFNNGVLEIVMQAPPSEVRRGRQIEISEDQPQRSAQGAQQK